MTEIDADYLADSTVEVAGEIVDERVRAHAKHRDHSMESWPAPSPLPTDEDREALQRLIYTFETTDLGDNLAITTRDSYALADTILAAGFRRSVVSTPSDEVKVAAERAVHWHLSRLSKRDDWAEDDTAVGGHAAFIVDVLTEEGLLASAVSAPLTTEPHPAEADVRAEAERKYPLSDAFTASWVPLVRQRQTISVVSAPLTTDAPTEAAADLDVPADVPTPPTITDEMVRAAREVLDDPHDDWPQEGYWDRLTRAALRAALGGEEKQ